MEKKFITSEEIKQVLKESVVSVKKNSKKENEITSEKIKEVLNEVIETSSEKSSIKNKNTQIIKENKNILKEASKYKLKKNKPDLIKNSKKNEKLRKEVIETLFEKQDTDKNLLINSIKNDSKKEEIITTEEVLNKQFNSGTELIFKNSDSLINISSNKSFIKKLLNFIETSLNRFINTKLKTITEYIDSKFSNIYKELEKTEKLLPKTKGIMGSANSGMSSVFSSNPVIPPGPVSSSLIILNDGLQIDTAAQSLNFIGVNVDTVTDGNGNINIFIPPAPASPYFNTLTASVNQFNSVMRNISAPLSEGNPFKTGSIVPGTKFSTVNQQIIHLNTSGIFSIKDLTTLIKLNVFDADGISVLIPELSITTSGNQDTGYINGLRIVLSSFLNEGLKYRGYADFYIDLSVVLNGKSGKFTIEAKHENGTEGTYIFNQTAFYDAESLSEYFDTISFSENIPVIKYLSGIAYYGLNSSFNINITNISDHNSDTFPDIQLKVSTPNIGFTDQNYSGPSDFNNYSLQFDDNGDTLNTSVSITQNNYRYRGNGAKIRGEMFDWNLDFFLDSVSASVLIDTYGTTSSQYIRTFDDEYMRFKSDYITPWNSNNALVFNEAMIFDGFLLAPNKGYLKGESSSVNNNWTGYRPTLTNPDYNMLTVLPVSYFTKITDSSTDKASFQILFSGVFVSGTALGDLISGDLKIFIRRINGNGNIGPSAVPLILHQGYYNFSLFDDGATVSGSRILEASSSANTINGTFGGLSCRDGIYMEIQINNSNIKIDGFTIAFF